MQLALAIAIFAELISLEIWPSKGERIKWYHAQALSIATIFEWHNSRYLYGVLYFALWSNVVAFH